MSKQQTAVEWLEEVFNAHGRILPEQFERAKEIERLEIKGAYSEGSLAIVDHFRTKKEIISAQTYYEQTYGTDTN